MSSDNLFDRLAELFKSSGPVNWRLAREIAENVAGEHEPIEPWLADEYLDLAATAAMRIDAESPLDPGPALADIRAVDGRTWAGDNVEALAYLAEPVSELLADGGGLGGIMGQLTPALLGMQMGSVTGSSSRRALGHFDVGLPGAEHAPISFIVPNVEGFATAHGFDARQVRLWVAFKEVAHHAGLAVPWVRERFLMLVHEFVEHLDFDPDGLARRIEGFQDPESLQQMMESGTTLSLFSGAQDGASEDIAGFMAIIEGYGDHLVDRTAAGLIPEAPRMRDVLDEVRSTPSEGEQILEQMLGLDLDHTSYRRGATFCSEVERRWGAEALSRIWEGPETMPTAPELDDPVGWAARVLLDGTEIGEM